MSTGFHAKGGLRARLAWHQSTRGLGNIELWITGGKYTVENGGRIIPAGMTEIAARNLFERTVENHYSSKWGDA